MLLESICSEIQEMRGTEGTAVKGLFLKLDLILENYL